MGSLLQDFRFGMRMMRRGPGFTAVVIITLALGIAVTSAMFTVVNAVLIRSLPYEDAARVVDVWGKLEKEGIPRNAFSEPEFAELKAQNRVFTDVAGMIDGGGANLTRAGGEPLRVIVSYSTANFFPLLGVKPYLGRFYSAEEDKEGADNVAVLTYQSWKTKFAADRNIVGTNIELNGRARMIVGVLPKEFQFGDAADLWKPLALGPPKNDDRGSHYLRVVGRLKPGVTYAQATEDLNAFAVAEARSFPDYYRPDTGWGVYMVPRTDDVVGNTRPALLVLFGAVTVVLLIACANVANLLLARGTRREREIAVRAAMGASRKRLVRQMLTESVAMALVASVIGIGLAWWGVKSLIAISPDALPRAGEVRVDLVVLAFTVLVSFLTALFFGLAPAMHLAAPTIGLRQSLEEGGRGGSSGKAKTRLRALLVVSEMALSLTLLVGAGLLIRSFERLMKVSPGFQTDQLLTFRVALPEAHYKDGAAIHPFYRQLIERIQQLPGVKSVGAVNLLPLSDTSSSGSVIMEDTSLQGLNHSPKMPYGYMEVDYRWASAGYLPSLGIELLKGRWISDADADDAPLVAVIDESFANRLWPGQDPIGKHIAFDRVPKVEPLTPRWRTIVGVVKHVKHYALDVQGREQAYFPILQVDRVRDMFITVRTSTDPMQMAESVRAQLRSMDPDLPMYRVSTMNDLLEHSLAQQRFNLVLMSSFAGLALLMASIGVYGVMSYLVTIRQHEIGIRLALGAQQGDVVRMIVKQTAKLLGIGLAVGTFCALLGTSVMSTMVFGVSTRDPLTFIGVPLLLAGIGLLASYIPAYRGSRVDPVEALRVE